MLLNFHKAKINVKERRRPLGFNSTLSEEGVFLLDMGLFVLSKVSQANELQPVPDIKKDAHRFGIVPVVLSP